MTHCLLLWCLQCQQYPTHHLWSVSQSAVHLSTPTEHTQISGTSSSFLSKGKNIQVKSPLEDLLFGNIRCIKHTVICLGELWRVWGMSFLSVASSRLDHLGVFSDSAYWMHTLAASQLCFVIWLHYVFYAVTSMQNKQASSGCARWRKKQYPRQVSDLDDLGTGHRGLPDSAPVDNGWYSLISFKKN